jgi:tRNA dimethylallyltransferase
MPGDRAVMNQRIHARFGQMLDAGFEAEVRRLHDMPQMHADRPSMRAVGYRQLWRYVAGETGFEDACTQARTATRRYAKRQLTWLRGERDFALVDSLKDDCLARVSAEFGLTSATGAM